MDGKPVGAGFKLARAGRRDKRGPGLSTGGSGRCWNIGKGPKPVTRSKTYVDRQPTAQRRENDAPPGSG